MKEQVVEIKTLNSRKKSTDWLKYFKILFEETKIIHIYLLAVIVAEGEQHSRPESGHLSNTGRQTVCADKARDCTGKGVPGQRAGGSGKPGELFCLVANSLRFSSDGIHFRVVLASHSDSGSFLVAQVLFSQDGC